MIMKIRMVFSQAPQDDQPAKSDKLGFMKKFWAWTKKSNPLEEKNCLILNFGIYDFQYNSIRKNIKNIPYFIINKLHKPHVSTLWLLIFVPMKR